MVNSSSDVKLSFGYSVACAGAAACLSEFLTIPLDAAKVRMQLNKSATAPGEKAPTVFSTLTSMVKAPYAGLSAGFLRQMVFGSLRISLYEPIRNVYSSDPQNCGIGTRILAGMTSGAVAMLVGSPADLVKVRLQGDARRAPGTAPRYPPGIVAVFRQIIKTEGVRALWTGLGPNVARNCIVNASEMAAYDQFKTVALGYGAKDGLPLHFSAGMFAGFMAVVFGSPMDVIKTRTMNAKAGENGILHVFSSTMKEGPLAFYKGFWANFARLGSFNTLVFVFLEQFRGVAAKVQESNATIKGPIAADVATHKIEKLQ